MFPLNRSSAVWARADSNEKNRNSNSRVDRIPGFFTVLHLSPEVQPSRSNRSDTLCKASTKDKSKRVLVGEASLRNRCFSKSVGGSDAHGRGPINREWNVAANQLWRSGVQWNRRS